MTVFLKITDEVRADPGPGVILSIVEDAKPLAWISLQAPAMRALIWLLIKRYVNVRLTSTFKRRDRILEIVGLA